MKRILAFRKTLSWSFFMLVVFLLPADSLSKAPACPFLSKALHGLMFFIFTWLLVRERMKVCSSPAPHAGNYTLVIAIGILFGSSIEILQWAIGLGRTAEFLDVFYDASGILLAAVFIYLYYRFPRI